MTASPDQHVYSTNPQFPLCFSAFLTPACGRDVQPSENLSSAKIQSLILPRSALLLRPVLRADFSVPDREPLRLGLDVHFSSAFTAASSFYILFTVREVKAVVV